jgi:hypothetical protein
MISPRERYEREQFWELVEDISSMDTGSRYGHTGTFSRVFSEKRKKAD